MSWPAAFEKLPADTNFIALTLSEAKLKRNEKGLALFT